MEDDGSRDARPIRWLRGLTGVLVAVPAVGAVVVGWLAFGVLDRPEDLVVAAIATLPALAALVVRRRLVWLATALPRLRAELRQVADRPEGVDTGAGTDGVEDPEERDQVAVAADELDRRLRDRVTVRGLWRAVRWLRSPAAQAGSAAGQHLGPRASATVATTTAAAERVIGLVPLTIVAVWGTGALAVAALVLTLLSASA